MAVGIDDVAIGYAWENLKDPLARATSEGLSKAWRSFKISRAQEKYQRALLDIVRTTRLLGHPAEVDVDQTYADVYVYDKLTAIERFDIQALAEKSPLEDPIETRRKTSTALAVVKAKKRIFVLGKPGAGKTTFLKYLAILACKGVLPFTPFFVPLKHWADSGLSLLDYCASQLAICEFPDTSQFVHSILRSGKALILLDGLDEVNQEGKARARMITDLVVFSDTFADAKVCLTCRVASTDYSFERFTYVEIADFNEKQKAELISKWYANDPKRKDLFFAEWEKAEHAGIRELGQTPLLLALMCLVFDETLRFPLRRVELYKEAVEALLRRWDSSRNITRDHQYLALSLTRKEQFLSELAYANFCSGRYYVTEAALAAQLHEILLRLPRSDLEGTIDAIGVVKAVESNHGLIVERAHKIYSFSHLTIQEYFTAKYIVECGDPKALLDLATKCLNEKRWREVSLMTASLLPNAQRFAVDIFKTLDKFILADPAVFQLLEKGTATHTMSGKKERPRLSSKRQYDIEHLVEGEILDAVLDLIVQLEYSKTEADCQAVRRGRNLAHVLRESSSWAAELLRDSEISASRLLSYVRGCYIASEILNLSIVTKRGTFEDRILKVVTH